MIGDMKNKQPIRGFSKLSRNEKLKLITERLGSSAGFEQSMNDHLHTNHSLQSKYFEFSENTLSNYYLPYGVAPNFLINGKDYILPMVTEESSVVAAASAAAGFWFSNGGFHTRIIGTEKAGQVHFVWKGTPEKLRDFFLKKKRILIKELDPITGKMRKRGGGITRIDLLDKTQEIDDYYQLDVGFETLDAMGANFINSCLEKLAITFENEIIAYPDFSAIEKEVEIIMAILSNYTPGCRVEVLTECPINAFSEIDKTLSALDFVRRFELAVRVAQMDTSRAVTHNKGIFNGIDAVTLATGNDFRAVEACGHAFASREGQYKGLTRVEIHNNTFRYILDIPMAMGTVGGLTRLHPLAVQSLELLGNPSAEMLMKIAAAAGLANNFSAIRSLVTGGIQKGHMKMHLNNILNHFKATDEEKEKAGNHFQDRKISFHEVEQFLNKIR